MMGKLNSGVAHTHTHMLLGANRCCASFSLRPNFKGSRPGEVAGGDTTKINGLPAGPSLNPGMVLHCVYVLFAVT